MNYEKLGNLIKNSTLWNSDIQILWDSDSPRIVFARKRFFAIVPKGDAERRSRSVGCFYCASIVTLVSRSCYNCVLIWCSFNILLVLFCDTFGIVYLFAERVDYDAL